MDTTMEDDDISAPPVKKIRVIKTEMMTDDEASQNSGSLENAFASDAGALENGITFETPEELQQCKTEDANNLEEGEECSKVNDVDFEEIEKLKEFQVLDEVKSNEEETEDDNSESSDGEALPDDEIEKMLEEDLPEGFKGAPKTKEKPYVTRQKIVLEEKGINHFEVLPVDWMMVRHYSGMPVYLHKTTRVCTLAKPYFLGRGSSRRHDIPISAIPCYNYRRALEEEEKQKEIDKQIAEKINTVRNSNSNNDAGNDTNNTITDNESIDAPSNKIDGTDNSEEITKANKRKCPFDETTNVDNNMNNDNAVINGEKEDEEKNNEDHTTDLDVNGTNDEANEPINVEEEVSNIPVSRQPVVLPGGIVMAPPRVETVNQNWKTQHLTYEQVNLYCKALFKFKTLNIMHFKRWADRRKYAKARKTLQYPSLPTGTKLITIPASTGENGGVNENKAAKRDWVMNMNGCSYLSVFHEYVRRALQKQPTYQFQQLENAAMPYQATVYIGGMQYGVGRGSSKRQAKAAAAKASIHILIPEMKDEAPIDSNEPDLSFFDCVGIEDPRVTEFCAATCEPPPHAILRTCLLRNFGTGDRHIHTEMKKLEYQKIELTMKVGRHTATVVCKNKKAAKQRASQAILQALHPHVRSWGSLLRLYGSRSVKTCKEKKLEEQQITLLQDHATQNQPNHAVLAKLRDEMRRLRDRDAAVVPIGTLLLTNTDLPTHSGANLNNVDL